MSDIENEEQFEGDDMDDEEIPDGGEDQDGEEEASESEEPEELQEKDSDVVLTEEMIAECLTLLCKTGDSMAHAYIRMDAHDKALTDVSILTAYIHVRYVDLSKNKLRDIAAVNSLKHLLTLRCDYNRLTSAALDQMPYLQIASFANNRIKDTEGLCHPLLEHLNLNFNLIPLVRGLNPEKLTKLHTLELRGNRITSTAGFSLPTLKNLFLAGNKIKKIEGLGMLEHLSILHLRDNSIDNLDGFSDNLKNLQYINLKGNHIANMNEIKKLEVLPLLRAVVLGDNPIGEDDDYRTEVIIAVRNLERLDKDEYTEEERQEAQEQYETRRLEAMQAESQEEIVEEEVIAE